MSELVKYVRLKLENHNDVREMIHGLYKEDPPDYPIDDERIFRTFRHPG